MSGKKSQITIFMIMGILIILILSFVFYSTREQAVSSDILKSFKFESNINSIKSFMEDCNEVVAVKGAYYIAEHNGYYNIPALYKSYGIYNIAYSYQRSSPEKDIALNLSQIEQNYEDYIKDNLPLCVDHFNPFRQLGMDIREGGVESDVKILDDKVLVQNKYSIVIYKDGINEISELPFIEVPVRLGLMHNVSKQIVNWVIQEPNLISTNDINNLMVQLNMTASIDTINDTTIYLIRDVNSSILSGNVITTPSTTNEIFEYLFGAKFD